LAWGGPEAASAKDLDDPVFGPEEDLPIDPAETMQVIVPANWIADFKFSSEAAFLNAILIYDCHSLELLHEVDNGSGDIFGWTLNNAENQARCLLITGWHLFEGDGPWVQSLGQVETKKGLSVKGGFEDSVDADFNDITFDALVHKFE